MPIPIRIPRSLPIGVRNPPVPSTVHSGATPLSGIALPGHQGIIAADACANCTENFSVPSGL